MPTFMFRVFMEGPNNNKQAVHSLQFVLMLLLMLMLTEFKQSYAYACFCAFAFSTLICRLVKTSLCYNTCITIPVECGISS